MKVKEIKLFTKYHTSLDGDKRLAFAAVTPAQSGCGDQFVNHSV